jgi:hypothetical protein
MYFFRSRREEEIYTVFFSAHGVRKKYTLCFFSAHGVRKKYTLCISVNGVGKQYTLCILANNLGSNIHCVYRSTTWGAIYTVYIGRWCREAIYTMSFFRQRRWEEKDTMSFFRQRRWEEKDTVSFFRQRRWEEKDTVSFFRQRCWEEKDTVYIGQRRQKAIYTVYIGQQFGRQYTLCISSFCIMGERRRQCAKRVTFLSGISADARDRTILCSKFRHSRS